jgi:hypothetical protein
MDEKDDAFAVLNKTREIHRQVFGLTNFMNDGCVDFRVPIEKIYVYFIVQILFRMPPPSSGTTRTSTRIKTLCLRPFTWHLMHYWKNGKGKENGSGWGLGSTMLS